MSVPRRTTPARRLTSAAGAAALTLLATACTSPGAPPPAPATSEPSSAPSAAYDGEVAVVPGDPCAGLTSEQVVHVLGDEPESTVTWAPGRRLPGTSEVADEHGCRHTAGAVTASAWVFAAPTTPAQARRLAREATSGECRRLPGVETFGDPGVAFGCALDAGTALTGMRGLVGDTWVACEVRGTDDAPRVTDWCAAVLASLAVS